MTFTALFTQYGYTTLVPALYVQLAGLTPRAALLLSATTGVISLGYAYLFARTVDRVGRKPCFVASFGVGIIGAACGGAASLLGMHSWVVLFVAGGLLMVGTIPIALGWTLYVPELFPTNIRATATGTVSAGIRVASAVVGPIAGLTISSHLGLAGLFTLFGTLMVIGLMVTATLGIETRQRTLEEVAQGGSEA
jgi:MFS transporter, putative metabolite:H+ symporter